MREIGMSPGCVVEECAEPITMSLGPLMKDMRESTVVQRRGKFCAMRILNAMHRPEDLFDSVKHDAITRLFALVICREAAVVAWMPIFGRDNKIKVSLQFVGEGNDFITVRHS